MNQKIIALIDCDSFFVSCERVDNPSLQDKPVCVMTSDGNKGIIISRSKEAKALGIKMGEPFFQIRNAHYNVAFLPARHNRYDEISKQVMNVIKTFSPDVEEVSIDEAYIDLTGLNKVYKTTYTDLIKTIRQTILEKTQIPVSIGLSSSKTLAKFASDKAKKNNGIFVIRPDKILNIVGNENIEDICGIGQQSAKSLKFNGIFTIKDFLNKDNTQIKQILGINGFNLKLELSGIATSPVNSTEKNPQSIQDTKSFEDFTHNLDFLHSQLNQHIHNAGKKLRTINGFCSEIGIILRTKDFNTITSYTKLETATNSEIELRQKAYFLLNNIYSSKNSYRSIGIELKKLSFNEEIQTSLFDGLKQNDDKLSRVLDKLERKFGKNIIKIGL